MVSTKTIIQGLLYCGHSTGDLCEICYFGKIYGESCSKKLLGLAARRLIDLNDEEEKEEEDEI